MKSILVENLAPVGLQLNTQKTKVLTTQTQPPSQLQTPNGLVISVLDRESSHKWLGCMFTTAPVQTTTCDVECRLQAAARAFNANRWILCDPKVSIRQTLTLTLNLHACRQPIWAQVRQVKPTSKYNTNNYGVSLTTTKHAEIIHQSTPQIRITSPNLPSAQMTITSVRNNFARPTSPGAPPLGRRPRGFQASTRLIQRSGGRFAAYPPNFQ